MSQHRNADGPTLTLVRAAALLGVCVWLVEMTRSAARIQRRVDRIGAERQRRRRRTQLSA